MHCQPARAFLFCAPGNPGTRSCRIPYAQPPFDSCEPVLAGGECYWCYAVALVGLARADSYPTRPVRIIVPYGPGGIADVTMRMVAQDLSPHFGQQFFIENRPGAGGVIGMQTALEAPADGYTLTMIGGGLTIAKALFKSCPITSRPISCRSRPPPPMVW